MFCVTSQNKFYKIFFSLPRSTFHQARNIFSSHSSAEEALSYNFIYVSITSFLMYIHFISAVFQTHPSSIYTWNRNSNNPVNPKHDRMNTSLAKYSFQTDQVNPMLSLLLFKYHSVTFRGQKSGPGDLKEPKAQRHRSLLTAPPFKPLLRLNKLSILPILIKKAF